MTVLKPDNRKSIGPFFHAGAGGAAATTRKRQENQLLQGLRELLTAVTPEPSQPPVNTDDTWVTVVRRGSGKGKGKGKVVSTPNKDVQPSLLEALKDLVRNAENGQAGSLLQMVQTYTSPQPKPRQVAQESMRNTGRWISDQPKIATRLVGQPKGGSSSWVKVDKIWWKKDIDSFAAASSTIDEGENPSGSLVVASWQQCIDLRSVAQTHGLSKAYVIVCKDSLSDEQTVTAKEQKGVEKWLQLHGQRWRKLWCFPLSENLPEWPPEPQIVDVKQGAPEVLEMVTLRVTISQQFVHEQEWDESMKKPVSILTRTLGDGIACRSYGWHVIPKDGIIMGFVKTTPENATKLLAQSGLGSCFFAVIGQSAKREPVAWVQRGDKQSPKQYLAEVRRKLKDTGRGIALRRGTKACLGVINGHVDTTTDEYRRKKWVARGVPAWTPQQLETLLASQGWRVLGEFQPPSHKKGVWCFKGVPPQSSTGQGMLMQLPGDQMLTISNWIPKIPKHQSWPLAATRKWVTQHDATTSPMPVVAESAGHNDDVVEVQPTQIEGDTQDGEDDARMTEHKRPAQAGTLESPEKKKIALAGPKGPSVAEVDTGLGPSGLSLWDLGGTGDCGFRAVIAQNAMRLKGNAADVESKVPQRAASLRTKCVNWLKANDCWHESFYVDPDATQNTEGGEVPQNPADYCTAVARTNKWADPWCIWACAEVLQSDILVFKYIRGKWQFLSRFEASKRVASTPMVLCLKNNHFTTIAHGQKIPEEWYQLGKDATEHPTSQSFLGGAKSSASGSSSAWLQPAPSSRPTTRCRTAVATIKGPTFKQKERGSAATNKTRQSSDWCKPAPSRSSAADTRLEDLDDCLQLSQNNAHRENKKNKPKRAQVPEKISWSCPVCKLELKARNSCLMSTAKANHLKSRHPTFNLKLVQSYRSKPVIEPVAELPMDQRDWSCPICNKGLPPLPYQEYKRSVAKHCQNEHPDETPHTLWWKRSKGKPKREGFGKHVVKNWQKYRKEQNKNTKHDIFLLPLAKGTYKGYRGRTMFCRKCLAHLQRNSTTSKI